jgi:hypothetical protein
MKLRPSPSGVIAVIALVVALGGTAIAADLFTDEERKQIETIAVKAFDERIGGASVKHAASADAATTATRAGIAGDSERLGGQPASAYQRTIQGGCTTPGSAIATINPQGQVGCTAGSSVRAFEFFARRGEQKNLSLGEGAFFNANCHVGNFKDVHVFNSSAQQVRVNFFTARPDSPLVVSGQILNRFDALHQQYNQRLHGQFIVTTPRAVTTIDFHAFDSGTFCEVTGTAATGAR